jgi:manganese-dependent inorganic pyrophosphatase
LLYHKQQSVKQRSIAGGMSLSTIYVFGHRHPDSDSVCSALAYAELKKALGFDAVAMKLDELNNETKFILKFFSIEEPETLRTIKTQVSDLEIDEALCVPPFTTIHAAWKLLKQHNKKALAIVNETKELLGLATLSDITRNFMDADMNILLAISNTPYSNIINTLKAKIATGKPWKHFVKGRIMIAAQQYNKIRNYVEKGDIVVAGIPENIREAILSGAQLVICTCGSYPEEIDMEIAKENKCDIITTEYDTFSTAMLIRQSVPISYVMSAGRVITVKADEFLDDVKERMLKTRYRNYPVLDNNNKVIGMISRYHLLSRKNKQAILVDHNELNQTVNGIDEAEILEIIDHHRLGDIQTKNPIYMKNEPVGSTSTIIACLYETYNIKISSKIAGILLSGIISDTLNFQSPTCTQLDKDVAKRLETIAEVNIEDLALKIINAGSTLRGKTVDEIICSDMKEYNIGKYKIGVAQVYSIDFESLSDMHEAILERMRYHCDRKGMDLLILLVTDLNRQGSEVLLAGEEKSLFFNAYEMESTDQSVFLPNVLSRKKQVIPKIMGLF